MKKFLIILSCVALLLPAAALAAFADDPVMTPLTAGDTISSLYFDPSVTFTISSSPVVIGSSNAVVGTTVIGGNTISVVSVYSGDSNNYVIGLKYKSGASFNNIDLYGRDDWDHIIVFSTPSSVSVGFADWYNSFVPLPPDPYAELGVDDGVSSSIDYTGELISFLTSNTTTIVLIGLSVAMFALLPFAISKIKQLIKGY